MQEVLHVPKSQLEGSWEDFPGPTQGATVTHCLEQVLDKAIFPFSPTKAQGQC